MHVVLSESVDKPLLLCKPFFRYCKICPKVEFHSLESIEHHISFKDPERHKAKLLEFLDKGEENEEEEE